MAMWASAREAAALTVRTVLLMYMLIGMLNMREMYAQARGRLTRRAPGPPPGDLDQPDVGLDRRAGTPYASAMVDRGELHALREREKELRCLYSVVGTLADRGLAPHDAFRKVLTAIPPGWQHPELTEACIEYLGRRSGTAGFTDGPWTLRSPIRVWLREVGSIAVAYRSLPSGHEGEPFLPEERLLLDTIAARLGEFLEWKHQELGGEPVGARAEHWRWRQRFAERLAATIDRKRFGIERIYLAGSTEAGTAGPGSDIDLIVLLGGDAPERRPLELWLEGYGACLSEVAYQQTGVGVAGGLLDVRLVDDASALVRLDPPPREL
jgi:hypothetical protein